MISEKRMKEIENQTKIAWQKWYHNKEDYSKLDDYMECVSPKDILQLLKERKQLVNIAEELEIILEDRQTYGLLELSFDKIINAFKEWKEL